MLSELLKYPLEEKKPSEFRGTPLVMVALLEAMGRWMRSARNLKPFIWEICLYIILELLP